MSNVGGHEEETHPHAHQHWDVHTEDDQLPSRKVVLVLVATSVFSIVMGVWAWRVQINAEHRLRPSGKWSERDLGAPHEINNQEQMLFDNAVREPSMRGAAQQSLEHWGWVDEEKGVARIPIERAMELVIQQRGQTTPKSAPEGGK